MNLYRHPLLQDCEVSRQRRKRLFQTMGTVKFERPLPTCKQVDAILGLAALAPETDPRLAISAGLEKVATNQPKSAKIQSLLIGVAKTADQIVHKT
ncbi:hypothetical protein Ciccas_012144, partial [Cichlidogyrus casuarinus]